MTTNRILNWAVIGAGNGGQAIAGHLGMIGASVRIYDVFTETIEELRRHGGVRIKGETEQFGRIDHATTSILEAVDDAEVIMVVTPASAHADVARASAPYLRDGQIILLNPGATGGAIEFTQTLARCNCRANVTVAEAQTLLFTCRSEKVGECYILATKKHVKVAAIPSTRTMEFVRVLNSAFPQFIPAINVLETSMNNTNAIVHPAPTLLNIGRIECKTDFLYYREGITPTIGAFLEELDVERVNVGRALGLSLESTREWYNNVYGPNGITLYEAIQKTKAYEHILAPKSVKTRYIYEDIPTGLVPIVSIGKMVGIPVLRMMTS